MECPDLLISRREWPTPISNHRYTPMVPVCEEFSRGVPFGSGFCHALIELLCQSLQNYKGDLSPLRLRFNDDFQQTMVVTGWRGHLKHLMYDVGSIQNSDLENLDTGSLRKIHAQRRKLERALEEINCSDPAGKTVPLSLPASYAREYSPDDVGHEIHTISEFGFPELRNKCASIKQDINDTTTLLIGAIGILDARDSRIQARRSTALTALAAVYLPLSLTTGIFGMNIWEINAGIPKWWAVVAIGIGLLVVSIPLFVWIFVEDPALFLRKSRHWVLTRCRMNYSGTTWRESDLGKAT